MYLIFYSYLGDNASVDSVSLKLREVCPNLYRTEDAVCSKVIQIMYFISFNLPIQVSFHIL